MLISEVYVRQIICLSSIRIAKCYVRHLNILLYERHVLWEIVPDHKVGVTYPLNEDLQAHPLHFLECLVQQLINCLFCLVQVLHFKIPEF